MERGDARGEDRLSGSDVERYSRQMLVPGFFGGAAGQLRLQRAHVLVVGCGGLGCPSAMCLAGAGVGTISLVDDDVVAKSNLHRQLAHTSKGAERGQTKVDSLQEAMLRLNPSVSVRTHQVRVNELNATELVRGKTVVLDCTDNPAARYLVGDACALEGVPLVSAAALGCDGQLSLHGFRGGPCYRCLHPSPPPSGTVGSCDESGVLGPVTSTMGSLQAMEALKVVAGADPSTTLSGKLLSVDAADARFRVVKLRGKRPECPACGVGKRTQRAVVLDVRSTMQRAICRLPGSMHTPLAAFPASPLHGGAAPAPPALLEAMARLGAEAVVCVCRRGIDSLTAAKRLRAAGLTAVSAAGGLNGFKAHCDPAFPAY